MLWKSIIGYTLKTLAITRRDTQLTFEVPREEIDKFIVERFGELIEKYDSMDKEALDVEQARLQGEGEELIKRELKEIIRGTNL